MTSVFDILSLSLFVATAAMYIVRFRHEDPPFTPYILIALACAAGSWLGEDGHAAFGIGLLIAGAFLLLHIASLPYPEEDDRR